MPPCLFTLQVLLLSTGLLVLWNMEGTQFVRKTTSLEICDLPADILILIFSLLHSQDIARCMIVCHCFSDVQVVHSDIYLRYKVEPTQNGMVDGRFWVAAGCHFPCKTLGYPLQGQGYQ
ncbi:hypothetical protein V8D89_006803 [Ganoderma adspersum]